LYEEHSFSDFGFRISFGLRLSDFALPPRSSDGIGYAAFLASIMKISDIPQSGHLGTFITFKNRFGQVRRPYVWPTDPRTLAQQGVRDKFGRMSALWRTLTEEQRAAWRASALDHYSRARLGKSGPLTGLQLFVKINNSLAFLGLPPVMDPPTFPKFVDNPVGALTITNNGSVIALKLAILSAPPSYLLVSATAPGSVGASFPGRFVFIGLLPVPVAGVSDITALYVARYGIPPVGTRIFIQTTQQVNGWQSLPQRVTAVVPMG
jgi:hypothetical protein